MISYSINQSHAQVEIFLKYGFDLVKVKPILDSLANKLNDFPLLLPVEISKQGDHIYYFTSGFRSASGYSGLTMAGLNLFFKQLKADYQDKLSPYFIDLGVRFITEDIQQVSETVSRLVYKFITPYCLTREEALTCLSFLKKKVVSCVKLPECMDDSFSVLYDGERKMFILNVLVPKEFKSEALRKELETLI